MKKWLVVIFICLALLGLCTIPVLANSGAYPRWDVNEDGTVNILDVSVIGQHWGEKTIPIISQSQEVWIPFVQSQLGTRFYGEFPMFILSDGQQADSGIYIPQGTTQSCKVALYPFQVGTYNLTVMIGKGKVEQQLDEDFHYRFYTIESNGAKITELDITEFAVQTLGSDLSESYVDIFVLNNTPNLSIGVLGTQMCLN